MFPQFHKLFVNYKTFTNDVYLTTQYTNFNLKKNQQYEKCKYLNNIFT